MKIRILMLILAGLVHGGLVARAEETPAKLVDLKKIWDQGNHNAFTDLLHHDGNWYCVFREGKGHVSPDGLLRVLTSKDGETWTSAAAITDDKSDLRDAKISVTPDGRLCLAGAGAWHDKSKATHQSFVWYSKDGKDWGEAIPVGDPNFWLWRVTWHEGKGYGVGYFCKPRDSKTPHSTKFYKTEDGKNFTPIVPNLTGENYGYVNESGLIFTEDGTAISVLRRDGGKKSALLGKASAPYTDWTLQELNDYVGGPQMLQLPDGRIVVGGRKTTNGAKTALWWLDPASAKLTEILELPSGGDTSYPGLVYHNGQLWVSYYSSHEGKTNIYLARVELPKK